MNLADLLKGPLSGILGTATSLIDSLHTSEQEKLAAKLALMQAEKDFQLEVMRLDAQWAETQAGVIKAETQSESWMARNWRPILMLTFTFIIAWNFILAPIFSVEAVGVPESMWELLKLGIGGYVVGRSCEKIIPQVMSK